MLKSIPIILLASASIHFTEIDHTDKNFSADPSEMNIEETAATTEELYEEPDFNTVLNQYSVEDLATFSQDDLIESDIIAYDEHGQIYNGIIRIQDFEGSGLIEDDQYNEHEILITFSPEGNLIVCSEHSDHLKVEILNYRIAEMSTLEQF